MRLTIRDLESDSGLARRTIHYYTRRGLLPGPAGLGRRAFYGEEHLLRLRLIRVLKRGGLRLDRIATTLDALSLAQMRRLAELSADPECRDPHALAAWLGTAWGTAQPPMPRVPTEPDARDRQWVRHRVHDGLEIHYCSDADDEFQSRVAELQRLAARLFAGLE